MQNSVWLLIFFSNWQLQVIFCMNMQYNFLDDLTSHVSLILKMPSFSLWMFNDKNNTKLAQMYSSFSPTLKSSLCSVCVFGLSFHCAALAVYSLILMSFYCLTVLHNRLSFSDKMGAEKGTECWCALLTEPRWMNNAFGPLCVSKRGQGSALWGQNDKICSDRMRKEHMSD